jgi:hypothetical protein
MIGILSFLCVGLVRAYQDSDFGKRVFNIDAEPGQSGVFVARIDLPEVANDEIISTSSIRDQNGDSFIPSEGDVIIKMTNGIPTPDSEADRLGFFDINNDGIYQDGEGVIRSSTAFMTAAGLNQFNVIKSVNAPLINIGAEMLTWDYGVYGYVDSSAAEFTFDSEDALVQLVAGPEVVNIHGLKSQARVQKFVLDQNQNSTNLFIPITADGKRSFNQRRVAVLEVTTSPEISFEVVSGGDINLKPFTTSDGVCIMTTIEGAETTSVSQGILMDLFNDEPDPLHFLIWADSTGNCGTFNIDNDVILLNSLDINGEGPSPDPVTVGVGPAEKLGDPNVQLDQLFAYIDGNRNGQYDCERGDVCEPIVINPALFTTDESYVIGVGDEGQPADLIISSPNNNENAGAGVVAINWESDLFSFVQTWGIIGLGETMAEDSNAYIWSSLGDEDFGTIETAYFYYDTNHNSNYDTDTDFIFQVIFNRGSISNGERVGLLGDQIFWYDFDDNDVLDGVGGDFIVYSNDENDPFNFSLDVIIPQLPIQENESIVFFNDEYGFIPYCEFYDVFESDLDLCYEGGLNEDSETLGFVGFSAAYDVIRDVDASGLFDAYAWEAVDIELSEGDTLTNDDLARLRLLEPRVVGEEAFCDDVNASEKYAPVVESPFFGNIELIDGEDYVQIIHASHSLQSRVVCVEVDINENAVIGREWRPALGEQGITISGVNYLTNTSLQLNDQNSRLRIAVQDEGGQEPEPSASSRRRSGGSGVVLSASIVISEPVESSQFNFGENIELKWTSSNLNTNATFVSIDFSSNGNNWINIANNVANTGNYILKSEQYAVGDNIRFRVRITDLVNTITEASTGRIVIKSIGAPNETVMPSPIMPEDSNPSDLPNPVITQPNANTVYLPSGINVGDRVQPIGRSSIYFVDMGGLLRLFEQERIYKTYHQNFNGVKTINLADYNRMLLGAPMTPAPGSVLVKTVESDRVYYLKPISGNSTLSELIWIENEEVAKDMFGEDWNQKIIDIDTGLLKYFLWRERRNSDAGLNRDNVVQPRIRWNFMGR